MEFVLVIIGLIFWIGYRTGKKSSGTKPISSSANERFLYDLLSYEIAKTKSKPLKIILTKLQYRLNGYDDTVATDYAKKYLDGAGNQEVSESPISTVADVATATVPETVGTQTITQPIIIQKAYTPVDKTALLLYFGAFLFITSVGLFVAFGGLSGGLRTVMVALVAAAIYGLGSYLYHNVKSLIQVGEAFVGIGMLMIPLIGVAGYSYIFDQSNGLAIWVITSFVALSLYVYTVTKMRTTFVSYMLIGSIVSSFLAMVGILEAPLYGFIWMLIVVGFVLQAVSIWSKDIKPLHEASRTSAMLISPLSVFLSMIALADSGSGQLAVTLGLSSVYYAMQIFTDKSNKVMYLTTAHALAIVSIAVGAFSLQESIIHSGYALLGITWIHILIYLFKRQAMNENMSIMAISTAVITPFITYSDPILMHVSIATIIIYGIVDALRNKSVVGLGVASVTWLLSGVTVGQILLSSQLTVLGQVVISSLQIIMLLIAFVLTRKTVTQEFSYTMKLTALTGVVLVMIAALFTDPYVLLNISIVWYVLLQVVAQFDSDKTWTTIANTIVFTPLVYAVILHTTISEQYFFSVTATLSLAIAIFSALLFKSSWPRWTSVFVWLILPYAFAFDGLFGFDTTTYYFMWSYLVVAVFLAFSRLIALGRIISFSKATLQSMMLHESISYSLGFFTALTVSMIATLASPLDAAWQALFMASLAILLITYGVWIERNKLFYALIPIAIQIVLTRFFIPNDNGDVLLSNTDYKTMLPLASSIFGCIILFLQRPFEVSSEFKTSSLIGAYYGPFLAIIIGVVTWPMPFGFFAATIGTYLLYRNKSQSSKELLGALIVVGFSWILWFYDIHNILVYTHIAAFLLVFYAYVRNRLGDTPEELNYTHAALVTISAPMVIAALQTPSTYGLLLLLEQTVVFLVGITLSRPYITKWGLYAAVGTVVFQLRGLGWVALAFLSLFIIGLAIYNALKNDRE